MKEVEVKRFDDFVTKGYHMETKEMHVESHHADKKGSRIEEVVKVVKDVEVKRFDDFVTKGYHMETKTVHIKSQNADKKGSHVETKNKNPHPIYDDEI